MSHPSKKFVLPKNLLIVPRARLPRQVSEGIASCDGDTAITLSGTRWPSKLVDSQFARLLEQFRTPRTIAQGILAFSIAEQLSPHEVLSSALPSLEEMLASGFLVCDHEIAVQEGNDQGFLPGESIGRYIVDRAIQVLNDSEVYRVTNSEGEYFALKLYKHHGSKGRIPQEVEVLRKLVGPYHPVVASTGNHAKGVYVVMEWIDGISIDRAAERYRHSISFNSFRRLNELFIRVVQAFKHLHCLGIVHGDIHPGNIIVDSHDRVRILDFDLSRCVEISNQSIRRGAIAYFMDPELARAKLVKERHPASTYQSDQFALGAVLYFSLTGRHYLDFSLERNEMLRQIVEDAPLPIARFPLRHLDAITAVIFKALAKDPTDRFSSLDDMESALLSIETANGANHGGDGPASHHKMAIDAYYRKYLNAVESVRYSHFSDAKDTPLASINYGAAGTAFCLHRISRATADPVLLAESDKWAVWSRGLAGYANAFVQNELGLTSQRVSDISIYHGIAGVLTTTAIIGASCGNAIACQEAIEALVSLRSNGKECEVTFGKAGFLLGISTVLEEMPLGLNIETEPLRNIGRELCADISTKLIDDNFVETNGFLGIAHGVAGVAYSVLRWHRIDNKFHTDNVKVSLAKLESVGRKVGRGMRWPRQLRHHECVSGWCNGSAGFVHLWALAFELFTDERYLSLAEAAAWDTWDSNELGYDLCCGSAGRAYALIRCYQATGNAAWLEKAHDVALSAVLMVDSIEPNIGGVIKGTAGVALLAAELGNPEDAKMPFF